MSMQIIPGAGRAARKRRQKLKRIILFASLGVILLLAVLSSVLLALEISRAADKLPPKTDTGDETTPNPPSTDISAPAGYRAQMYDSAKASEGVLVLVNKTHKYVFPAVESNLSEIRTSRNKQQDGSYSYSCNYDMLLDTVALRKFNEMMDAFYAETGNGFALINAAYRTAEEQENMNGDIKGGHSDHHTGLLVAIKFYADGNMYSSVDARFADAYEWLNNNAAKYGFINRYPDNKASVTGVSSYSYAYRYVGVPHATYMAQNGLCLEEYIELLKTHTYNGSHLSVKDGYGVEYETYYIPAAPGAQTSIYTPDGKNYDISGDNDGGFVITVRHD